MRRRVGQSNTEADEIYASLHTERILLFCRILAFSFSESSQTQPRETTREASDLLSAALDASRGYF